MMRKNGFTLLELIISMLILSVILTGGSLVLLAGQSAWSTADTKIKMQESLRQTLERIAKELQESGTDKDGNLQVTIFDGTGVGGTDVLRFSIPLCVCSNSSIDSNGDVAYWGAPVTWGATNCSDNIVAGSDGKVAICHLPPGNPSNTQDLRVAPSAVDAHLEQHGDWMGSCIACSVDANKYIEYLINADGRLVRRVLDGTLNLVREDVFGGYLTDFQMSISADNKIVGLTVDTTAYTDQKRQMNITRVLNVFLRNRT